MTVADSAKRALWKRGELDWKLHSGQLKIKHALHNSKGKLFVGNCSRQLGKSYEMVTEAIECAIKTPKARIKYGTAFLSDLVEFIQPNFEKIIEDCPSSIKPIYRSQKSKWIFPHNNAEIKLVGLDKNPDGMRGNAIDLSVLDECGFVSELDYLYKSVLVPATTHRPDAKIILISTPPKTPAHEFGDYAQRAEAEGNYIKLTIYDNPMIGPERIAELMHESGGADSTTWKREYLCEFVTDSDSQIVPEWNDKYVIARERDEFYKFYHKYDGMDLGRKDKTALIFSYYDFKRATLVVEDEAEMAGPTWTTVTLKETILKKERDLWGEPESLEQPKVYRRISDNNNPHLIQDLNALHNVHFIETNKESLEAMVNELRVMVAAGRIEVHPRCKMLIGCLKYGVWDSKRKTFARSSSYGHFDHLAALIYKIRNLDRALNPVPATYGFDIRNSVIKTPQHNSEGAKLMGKIFHKPTRKPTY